MDDHSIMPFGIHRGKKMANVPSVYLLWIHQEGKCTPEVKLYIEENLDAIRAEAKYEARKVYRKSIMREGM